MNTRNLRAIGLLSALLLFPAGCASTSSSEGQAPSDLVDFGGGGGAEAEAEAEEDLSCEGDEDNTEKSIFRDAAGRWRFRVTASNGEIVISSTNSYETDGAVSEALMEFEHAGELPRNYAVEPTADGQFVVKAYVPAKDGGSRKLVAISERYVSWANAERARKRTAQLIRCSPQG